MKLLEIETKIDWNKRQWFQNKQIPSLIVLSNPSHITNIGNCFSGTALPCETYPAGYYGNFQKNHYKPLEYDILFVISNKD